MAPEQLDRLYRAVCAGDVAEVRARLAAPGELEWVNPATGLCLAHEAARLEQPEILELLVEAGADVEAKSIDGRTPLFEAACRNRLATVRMLLARGADPKVTTVRGKNNLAHVAARSNSRDLLALLLDAGVDGSAKNGKGETPLTVAISRGHREVVALLLARGADPHLPTRRNMTAVHRAIEAHASDLGGLLWQHGAPEANANHAGEYLEYLVERLNKNDLNQEECAIWAKLLAPVGVPPLLAVLERRLSPLMQILLAEGADANQADAQGRTPLGVALALQDWPAVEAVVAARAKFDTATPEARARLATALRKVPGATLFKLAKAGLQLASLETFDWSGVLRDSFLKEDDDMFAAAQGAGCLNAEDLREAVRVALAARDPERLRGLLGRGADASRAFADGATPLACALKDERWEHARILLSFGARPALATPAERAFLARVLVKAPSSLLVALGEAGLALADLQDFDWDQAGSQAARRGDADFFALAQAAGRLTPDLAWAAAKEAIAAKRLHVVKRLASVTARLNELLSEAVKALQPEMVTYLLEQGADPNAGDALLLALKERNVPSLDIARSLLAAGARCDVVRDGVTALHLAAGHDDWEYGVMVKRLLEGGAVLQALDPGGQTALHRAAASGSGPNCQALLAAGADPELRDGEGRSAKQLAFDRMANKGSAESFLVFFTPPDNVRPVLERKGHMALLEAIHDRDVALVHALLAAGVPLDWENPSYLGTLAHLTPLSAAVETGQLELMRALLDHGAHVDFWITAPRALTLAIQKKDDRMLELLLERGADPNLRSGRTWTHFDHHSYTDDVIKYRGTDEVPLDTAHYDASKTRLLLAAGADLLQTSRPIEEFGEKVRPILLAALEARLPEPARATLLRWKEFGTWKKLHAAARADLKRPVCAAWHPTRSLVAHAEAGGTVVLSAWHAEALFLEPLRTFTPPSHEQSEPVALRWSRDGGTLAVETRQGTRVLLSEGTGEPEWEEPRPRSFDGAWRAELARDGLAIRAV